MDNEGWALYRERASGSSHVLSPVIALLLCCGQRGLGPVQRERESGSSHVLSPVIALLLCRGQRGLGPVQRERMVPEVWSSR